MCYVKRTQYPKWRQGLQPEAPFTFTKACYIDCFPALNTDPSEVAVDCFTYIVQYKNNDKSADVIVYTKKSVRLNSIGRHRMSDLYFDLQEA